MTQVPDPAGADDAVVVGVDGSEPSRRALQWAAVEARSRGVPLRVVHAFPFPPPVARGNAEVEAVAQRLRAAGDEASDLVDGLVVDTELLDDTPAKALVAQSRRSALVVVGGRGHGGFASLLLGSTAIDVTAHAECPVVVIPDRGRPLDRVGPVVVGVDPSAGSAQALEFAFARAADRDAVLVAMRVVQPPTAYGIYGAGELLRTDSNRVDREARAQLGVALAPWKGRYPRVEVHEEVARGQIVAELVAASHDAETVVVGARGRSALAGMILGSVSQGLLHHSTSPVAVVR